MDLFELSAKITLDTSEYERAISDAKSGFLSPLLLFSQRASRSSQLPRLRIPKLRSLLSLQT